MRRASGFSALHDRCFIGTEFSQLVVCLEFPTVEEMVSGFNRCSAKLGMDIAIKDGFVHLFVLQKRLTPPFLFSHPV